VYAKLRGERADVRSKRTRVDTGAGGMKRREPIPVALLVVPGADPIEQ
jgi:hypothetical protein